MTKQEEISFEGGKRNLPSSWRWVKLGEISTVVRGSSPRPKGDPKYYGGNVPRLMVEDVTRDGMYVTPKVDFLTEEGAKLSRPMKQGDVIMVVSGAPGLPGILAVDACIHDGFVGFRDVEQSVLLNTFLFYFLKCANAATDSLAVGAIFRNLTTDQIKDIDVPLPPLDEQKRIAGILNEKMEGVEEARRNAIAQLEAAKDLPAAYLRSVFNSPEAQQWESKALGELLLDIYGGKSLSCEERPAGLDEWGVLKVSAVSWGMFKPFENKVLPLNFPQPERYEVHPGDIIISRANTIELVGASVLVGETRPRLMLSDKTLCLVPDETRILKPYLQMSLQSPQARNFIESHATGTSPSMKNISQDIIRRIPLRYPPLSEQHRIAANYTEKIAEAEEQLRKTLEEQLEAINKLPAAFLRQAFNGEL